MNGGNTQFMMGINGIINKEINYWPMNFGFELGPPINVGFLDFKPIKHFYNHGVIKQTHILSVWYHL